MRKIHIKILIPRKKSVQRQDDIDRLALQHELVDLRRQNAEYRLKAEDAEQALHLLERSHDDALATIEKLTADLKAERLKSVQLQHELKQAGNHKKSEADVSFLLSKKKNAQTLKHKN